MSEQELIEQIQRAGGGHANGATGKMDYSLSEEQTIEIIDIIRQQIGLELLDIDKYTNALATADTYRNMIREVCKLEADDLEGK